MPAPLYKLSIATTAEAEDAIATLLQQASRQTATTYVNADTGVIAVTVYLKAAPSPGLKQQIKTGLQRIKTAGLNPGPARVSLRCLAPRDWAESWKRHFRPLEIGSRLLIKPSWSNRRPRKGQAVLSLDPGLSFGTGQHPTTGFCLRQLAAFRKRGQTQSFLDVGTGSGILALAAACLGYAPVEAWDIDPQCIRAARHNARFNGLEKQVLVHRRDLADVKPGPKYSLVCANLVADLLLRERDRLARCLAPSGRLVLAGILADEFRTIQDSYRAAGLILRSSRREGDWKSGAFERSSIF